MTGLRQFHTMGIVGLFQDCWQGRGRDGMGWDGMDAAQRGDLIAPCCSQPFGNLLRPRAPCAHWGAAIGHPAQPHPTPRTSPPPVTPALQCSSPAWDPKVSLVITL